MNASQSPKTSLLVVAWIILLLVSNLPLIILQEVFGQSISSDQRTLLSLAFIVLAFIASLVWRPLRGLRPFLILMLALVIGSWLVFTRLDQVQPIRTWLRNPSFNVYMLAEQGLKFLATLIVIGALLLMRKKPADFYLTRGDLAAPFAPVRWMGVKKEERWNKFGAWLTVFISLGTLAFLVIAGRPSADLVVRVLPFLPAILLAAALNAFNEEMSYKAAFLSVLESPLGPRQALYMTAVFFGIGHYYGVPYGVIGVLLATFLGWILAKSMQETRGMFWAWFIHFWQDVWIFSFMALGSIIPGGG